jgi:hypothetical protein
VNPTEFLRQRQKAIAIRMEELALEMEALDVEEHEIQTALRVFDRYALRLAGPRPTGKSASTDVTEPIQSETPCEAPQDPVAPEVAATPAAPPADDKAIGADRRLKRFWTPERKAEASRVARENWNKRHPLTGRGTKDPESDTPVFKRKAGLQPVKIAPAIPAIDKKLQKDKKTGIFNKDTSTAEPAPAWRGKPGEKPDIMSIDIGGDTVSVSGHYLLIKGNPTVRLDKWQKAVMQHLMKNFPEQTLRVEVKGMVKDIDGVIGQLRGFIHLAPLAIETTHGGWKLVAAEKEAA